MTTKTKAPKPAGYPPTPELDRMGAVKDESHRLGEFLDWLTQNGYQLTHQHDHHGSDDKDEPTGCYALHRCVNCWCGGPDEPHEPGGKRCHCRREVELACGFKDGELYRTHKTFEKILADFFKIDLDKVENERRAILEWVQAQAESSAARPPKV